VTETKMSEEMQELGDRGVDLSQYCYLLQHTTRKMSQVWLTGKITALLYFTAILNHCHEHHAKILLTNRLGEQ